MGVEESQFHELNWWDEFETDNLKFVLPHQDIFQEEAQQTDFRHFGDLGLFNPRTRKSILAVMVAMMHISQILAINMDLLI